MKPLNLVELTRQQIKSRHGFGWSIQGIDSGSASLSMGHSIEAHHRNYPYSKESTTTNAFKLARDMSVA